MDRRLYERWAAGEISDEEYRLTQQLNLCYDNSTGGSKRMSKEANARYDAKSTKHYGFKLNCGTDADIIEMLDAAENKQALFKAAMRKYKKESQG